MSAQGARDPRGVFPCPVQVPLKEGKLRALSALESSPRYTNDLIKRPTMEIVRKEMLNLCFVFQCEQGDLEGVKAALERGANVNTTYGNGWTGLIWAVRNKHNSVVELLLKTPNIDVNQKDKWGFCALREAVSKKNFRLLMLLLNSPNIDVNIVSNNGGSAIYWAVERNSPFSLYWLLNKHPDMTALTINQKNGRPVKKNSPVMLAVKRHARHCLEVLATDPRVDLNTTDKAGRGLEEVAALAGLDYER